MSVLQILGFDCIHQLLNLIQTRILHILYRERVEQADNVFIIACIHKAQNKGESQQRPKSQKKIKDHVSVEAAAKENYPKTFKTGANAARGLHSKSSNLEQQQVQYGFHNNPFNNH